MKKLIFTVFLFALSFLAGRLAAQSLLEPADSLPASADGNWGLSFPEDGQPPVGNATFEQLKQYDAYYRDDTGDKILYLTFDAGYENGNTAAILDALKKHDAPATFFVVGNYLTSSQ